MVYLLLKIKILYMTLIDYSIYHERAQIDGQSIAPSQGFKTKLKHDDTTILAPIIVVG